MVSFSFPEFHLSCVCICVSCSRADIHKSRDQFLYRCCTSSDTTTKEKCDNPVPDILSASNTCHKHFRAADLGGMASLKRGVIRGGIGKGGSRTKVTKVSA